MRVERVSNNTFKGYDVMRLRGLYMQGLYKRGHKVLFEQMKTIANKESLELYLNYNNKSFETIYDNCKIELSWWGQDCLSFIKRGQSSDILWNTKKMETPDTKIKPLKDLKVITSDKFPRGGNYYLGYNNIGSRWLLINSTELKKESADTTDKPTEKELTKMFAVEPENIFILDIFNDDLDEIIRPTGYPYILVNDWNEALQNIENIDKKDPFAHELYQSAKKYILEKSSHLIETKTQYICEKLEQFGFIPIKIAGRYHYDINYMNALAWKNNSDKISYLTNSVKDSYQALEYLENLFERTLKERVMNIDNVYFVSGGPRTQDEKDSDSYSNLMSPGFYKDNVIMDLLAAKQGGIHCLTAEIPEELFLK